MSNFTVTIVGTGVIGSSLGLALKQINDAPRLLGHDKDLAKAKAAAKAGAFDKAEWNLINACEPADLIILAMPLNGIRPTLETIAPYLKEGAVISDTARSKKAPLEWAEALLPEHVHFVGGDPIVNPPGLGYEYASADLFRHKLYCLTPASSAHEQAVQLMVSVAQLVGAEPFFLDATEHDGLVTAVEQLPILLSTMLLKTLSNQTSWREARKMASNLFEQVSAGAAGDPDAIKEDFINGRHNLVHWLDLFMAQLRQVRAQLTDETLADSEVAREALAKMLDQAVVERHNWLKDFEQSNFADPELASPKVETPGLMKRLIGLRR
ncbi:MAG TPA: prephenate dehydrogenase/arogenate dehydrogenase family protein [Anaerolineae bacterium]